MFKNTIFIALFLSLIPYSIYCQNCITINQQPEDQLTLDNDDIILTVDAASLENLSYQWQVFDFDLNAWVNVDEFIDDFNYDGVNTETLTISDISPTINNAQYRVQIFGQSIGCNIQSREALITYAAITVNNLFTPNGDGFNELFIIEGLGRFPNSKLQIYNRWGNLIYEKINYQNDWDGISNTGFLINGSKKVPSGTYFYTIDLKFDNKKLSGWIYINR